MQHAEYQQLALRTSDNSSVDVNKIDKNKLIKLLRGVIANGNTLDKMKKDLAYRPATESTLAKNSFGWRSVKNRNLDPQIIHAILGIITEASEFAEALINYIDGNVDLVNLGEESGDIDWYQALLDSRIGCTQHDRWTSNINKLRARYPEKFTSSHAINRNLETEREVLSNSLHTGSNQKPEGNTNA